MLWRKILLGSIAVSFLILVGVIGLVVIGSFLPEPNDNSAKPQPTQTHLWQLPLFHLQQRLQMVNFPLNPLNCSAFIMNCKDS